jgi:AraC-like DNA-binding protein
LSRAGHAPTIGETSDLAAHVSARVVDAIGSDVPPVVRDALAAAIDCLPGRPSVERVSDALGLTYKAMKRELDRVSGPSPAAVMGWARIFYATLLLEERSPSVEHAAAASGFESGGALRHLCRRHAGARPLEIHARGGVEYLGYVFRRQLLAPLNERRFARVNGLSGTKVRTRDAQKVQL